jgi:hypothetical protein
MSLTICVYVGQRWIFNGSVNLPLGYYRSQCAPLTQVPQTCRQFVLACPQGHCKDHLELQGHLRRWEWWLSDRRERRQIRSTEKVINLGNAKNPAPRIVVLS